MVRQARGSGAGAPGSALASPSFLPVALADHPGFLIAKIAELSSELMSIALAEFGLSMRAASILLLLDDLGTTSQLVIGQSLRLERSTLSLATDELERDGWIERRRDPSDRRLNAVALTDKGSSAIANIQDASKQASDALLSPLDAAQREQLTVILRSLLDIPAEQADVA